LLSATVFAADCATADAWATAFMSMGHIKAIEILKSHPELSVLFIYSSNTGMKTYVSDAMATEIRIQP
jgi:thiamine biosynthesis lipoprotein